MDIFKPMEPNSEFLHSLFFFAVRKSTIYTSTTNNFNAGYEFLISVVMESSALQRR
jgi:hypothetical protein